ncbi:hypothetical protein [Klebsiella pneumoniae]|uniref:hypothetical protein n=1 Tax=Klebsiella pneumoniae TaxID=573 RepID=UPI0021F7C8E4|nr:hypothetical protein [Klebsiella pneumoniae]UYS06551.1 hypothetical protein NIL00_25840 [Klebsiella pneumoniae]
MSEVKVNGSACCGRSGRAAFTVPAKDCRHSAGNAVSRPRSSSLRRVPAPFPGTRITV